ncbi:hypothetical protein J5N97_028134 [Dioscorea zingiberensis]|uniref:Uncharacterized protein n=1 Tax=Dioscorea zingiberensis TaxID=325984 RepID=A0A9D5BZ00_9LILI|nr:hypothetical protein J5N97_028134 [Dioscorea zingiberensis]
MLDFVAGVHSDEGSLKGNQEMLCQMPQIYQYFLVNNLSNFSSGLASKSGTLGGTGNMKADFQLHFDLCPLY